ncbi:DUF2063 domain-containing protein [Pseudomonas sp. QL9]|uniref:HvfC family RiPP maturation protein n=1 Tax=Pseudomonas sp. QL9 TaxID=3242725 RepID=UPI003529DA8D
MPDSLHDQLQTLASHVRDPQRHAPPPGIEARRLAVYRQLFLGNIASLLEGAFPVLSASLGAQRWQALVEAFYAEHRCQTPLFTEVAGEFVGYLEQASVELPEWAAELAHYEWVETALLLGEDREADHDPEGDLLDGVPVLSAQAWPLAYAWPVADIGPDYLPDAAPTAPTLLLARRGADQQVHFSRLAPLAHALLLSLQQWQLTGREHLQALTEISGIELEIVHRQGLALLQALRDQGVVLGTRPNCANLRRLSPAIRPTH